MRPSRAAGLTATERARRARAEQLEELISTARRIFGRQGYHAASMDDIAAGLHVSKPTLYRHFEGKAELYRAVAQDAAQEMVRAVRAAAEHRGDNEARCQAAVRAYFDAVCSPDGVAHVLLAVDPGTSPEVAATVEWASRACIDAIAVVVAEETALSRDEARLMSAGLVGMCTATARHAADRDVAARREALGLTTRLLWSGIRSFPDRPPTRTEAT